MPNGHHPHGQVGGVSRHLGHSKATIHLNFRGQAREALDLYASIFGGEVAAFTHGDAHVKSYGAVPDQLM